MRGRHTWEAQLAQDAVTDAHRKSSTAGDPKTTPGVPPQAEIFRPKPFRVRTAAEVAASVGHELAEDEAVPYWARRFAKAWAALAAGVAVVLGAGIVTSSVAVVVSTSVGAVSAVLAVLAAPANADPR